MKVTDEMVEAAMAAFEAYFQDPAHERQCDECNGVGCTPVGVDADRDWCPKCGGPGTLNDATEEGGIRAALESFALSHAAGQEAVAEVGRDGSIIWLALRPLKAGIKLYTHPRTSPSGEVEQADPLAPVAVVYDAMGVIPPGKST